MMKKISGKTFVLKLLKFQKNIPGKLLEQDIYLINYAFLQNPFISLNGFLGMKILSIL